ncbi:MAG: hypothetical protein PHQ96_03055 [Candidatus Omnitrophica bacterium]|nr:hypothetical protein [Candidatus Omnitrophota bacterium]
MPFLPMKLFDFFKNLIKPRKRRRALIKIKKAHTKSHKKRKSLTHHRIKKKLHKRVRPKLHKKKLKKIRRNKIGKSRVKHKSKKAKKLYKAVARKPAQPKEKEIGVITHYFDKITVGIIKLKSPLAVGEQVHIKGAHDDFTQIVSSMQYNHKNITYAEKGLEIGIRVVKPVHENDLVYIAE